MFFLSKDFTQSLPLSRQYPPPESDNPSLLLSPPPLAASQAPPEVAVDSPEVVAGIAAHNLNLGYKDTLICKNINFFAAKGRVMGISGESGSGKTTLLKYLRGDYAVRRFSGKLTTLQEGVMLQENSPQDAGRLAGKQSVKLSPKKQKRHIGFISQHPNLVGRSNVMENILSSILYDISFFRLLTNTVKKEHCQQALQALESVSLRKYALQRCDTLSGGQQQRVSIAKAIVKRPMVLLADEPIASLDPENAERIFSILVRLAREMNIAVVVILHQPKFLERCDSVLHFSSELDDTGFPKTYFSVSN